MVLGDSVTAPKVPALLPGVKVNLNTLGSKPLTALPAASLTAIVSVTVPPEGTLRLAKVALEAAALTGPAVTEIGGFVLSSVPLILTVKVLGVSGSAIVPVKAVV